MSRKFIPFFVAISVIIQVTFLVSVPLIEAGSHPDNEDKNPPVSGSGYSKFQQTWYIGSGEKKYYGNQTIDLFGDLIINKTGKLYLYNVTLAMNCSYEGQFTIKIEDGGMLDIRDSVITNPAAFTYNFEVHGSMVMDHCNVSRMYAENDPMTWEFIGGIEVYSTAVTINNSYFHKNMNNIYVHTNSSGAVMISNNTMVDPLFDEWNSTYAYGIIVSDSSIPYIYKNSIYSQGTGIEVWENANPTIKRNRIANSNRDGILIYDQVSANVDGNVLNNCPGAGVNIMSTGLSIVKNNHMFKNGHGVNIYGGTVDIIDNVVENNTENGINIGSWWWNVNPTIKGNDIKYNGVQSGWGGYGIYIDSTDAHITRNTITNNGPVQFPTGLFKGGGIYISSWEEKKPVIDNNTIKYNAENGIDVAALAQPFIEFNDIHYNNRTGICIDQTNGPIRNNRISYNRIGIHLNTVQSDVQYNTISYQEDIGIMLTTTTSSRIARNTIVHNGNGQTGDAGILHDGSSGACNAFVVGNDISNNSGRGISIISSNPTIRGNTINHNTYGIHALSGGGWVEYNVISHNTGSGVLTDSSAASPQLEKNTFRSNKIGALLANQSSTSVRSSWFFENEAGIKVSKHAWPTVEDCTFDANDVAVSMDRGRLTLRTSTLTASSQYGLDVTASNFTVDNSSIANSVLGEVRLDGNSHVVFLNTTFDRSKVTVADALSGLDVYWYLHLIVHDDTNKPLTDAYLQILNGTGELAFARAVPASGQFRYITLKDFHETQAGRTYATPYRLLCEKDGYVKYDKGQEMDSTRTVTLSLAKNFKPSGVGNIRPHVTHDLTPDITWDAAVDPDSDPITYVVNVGTTVLGSDILNDTDGETTGTHIQLTEPLDYGTGNRSYHITIRAYDGRGGMSTTQSIMYVVNNKPTTPVAVILPERPNVHTGVKCTVTLPAGDIDNDNLTYNYVWTRNGEYEPSVSVYNSTGTESAIPDELLVEPDRWKCTVTAYDGFVHSEAAETAEVQVRNFAPAINSTPDDIKINEDTQALDAFCLRDVFTDENGEVLTYGWNTSDHVEVHENNSWISFTPEPDWSGTVSFRFTAQDQEADANFVVKVTVRPVNDLPVLEPPGNHTIDEDEWANITITAYDHIDNEEVFIITDITDVIPGIMIDINYKFKINTGELQLKPDNGMVGSYTIKITADDKHSKVYGTLNLTINNVNDKPVAKIGKPLEGDIYKAGELIQLDGTGSTDEDQVHGDRFVSITWMLDDSKVLNTSLSGECKINKGGTHKITLILKDASGAEAQTSVTVTITGADDKDDGVAGLQAGVLAAVAAIIIVIVVLALLVFLRMRKRKVGEEEKAKEAQAAGAVAQAPAQMPLPGQAVPALGYQPYPAPQLMPGMPAPVYTGEVVEAEVPSLPPSTIPEEEVEGEVVDETAYYQEEPVEEPVDAETPEPGYTTAQVDQATPAQAAPVQTAQAQPVAPPVQGYMQQPQYPQAPYQQPYYYPQQAVQIPMVACPDCGSAARFHPMNRKIIICPLCGPLKTD